MFRLWKSCDFDLELRSRYKTFELVCLRINKNLLRWSTVVSTMSAVDHNAR